MSTRNAEGSALNPNHAARAAMKLVIGSQTAPMGHLIFTTVASDCAAATIARVRDLGLQLRFQRARATS